jgi:outer membrane protein assembly factor BamB
MPARTLAASPNPALAPSPGDWPQYGHDAAHSGYNAAERIISPANVANLKLAWTASTRQGIVGFVVAEGVVFVSGGNGGTGKLYEYPVGCASGGADCAPLWTVTVTGSSITAPAADDGVVYVGSSDGKLYAYTVGCASGGATCSLPLWTAATGSHIVSSPVVADGVVYVGTADGKLYAYAVGCASGGGVCSPLWTATMSGSLTAAPAVAGGLVYAEPDNDDRLYVYRVGCASGGGTCTPLSIVVLAGRNPFNSPVVSNGVVYATPTTGGLHAYPVSCFSGGATCSPLLTADAETSPAVADGILHVGWGTYQTDTKTYGVIYAYGVGCATGGATCKPLWDDLAGSVIDSPPSVANGVVYAGSRDGTIQAFAESGCASDAGLWVGERTCLPLWSATTSGGIYSSPVVSNGVVYVVSTNDGNLYAFSLSGATPPATSTAMPPSSNEPGAPIWSLVLGLAAFFGGTLLTLSRRQRPIR